MFYKFFILTFISLLSLMLSGCSTVKVKKPEVVNNTICYTEVEVFVLGTTKVSDFTYDREPNQIHLAFGEAANNPKGISGVVDSAGNAVTNVTTGGALGVIQSIIHKDTVDVNTVE